MDTNPLRALSQEPSDSQLPASKPESVINGNIYSQQNSQSSVLSKANLKRYSSNDSVRSLASLDSGFWSASSASSQSSRGSRLLKTKDRLVRLLSADYELRLLYHEALQMTTLERFEENFRRCIMQLSEHLQCEAFESTPQMKTTARYISACSRYAAGQIRSELEQETQANPPSVSYLHTLHDDIEDAILQEDGTVEDDTKQDETKEADDAKEFAFLEVAIQESNSWQLFRENLRLFLHPNQIKRALFYAWPVNQPKEEPYRIQYSVNWEISRLLKSFFPDGQKVRDILTLTGDSNGTIAQSCQDYLRATWPGVGDYILEAAEKFLVSDVDDENKSEYCL